MSLWSDGLSALAGHTWEVFAAFLIILWGFIVVHRFLFRLFGNSLSKTDLISLSAAGWVIPALFLSILVFGISLFSNAYMGGVVAIVVILLSVFWVVQKKTALPHLLLFLTLLFPLLILRLAFITDLFLPSYFDSAEHYRLISAITETYHTSILSENLQGVYYHLGFHSLTAFISHFLRVDILELMLVFGQIILALLPAPFFFIIKRETNSTPPAFFACLLAGFGFHMPAYSMNWGKYPALLGLLAAMFVFNLLYMSYGNNQFKQRKPILVLSMFSILASVLIHSRMLVLYGILFIAFYATLGLGRLPILFRLLSFPVLAGFFVVEIFAVQNNPTLKPLLNTYLANDLWTLCLLVPLTVLSAIFYPKPTFFTLTWFILVILCMFMPISMPVHGVQALLDRPFVQMFSIIPFSILAGFGFAGLTQLITRLLLPGLKMIQPFITFLLFGFVLLNIALNHDFYPSECCRFATRDDLSAFTWMDKNLPPNTTILIASANLHVTSFESSKTLSGVDAGIWINLLLSRRVEFAAPGIQFDNAEIHADLCGLGVEFIYAGGMLQSFDPIQMERQPAWYSPSFLLPLAKVYRLAGCQK